MSELKCADLVVGKKNERLEQLRVMLDACYDSLDTDYADESIYEFGLSFDYVEPHTYCDCDVKRDNKYDVLVPAEDCEDTSGYWRYQLSWGGPSDEFRFHDDGRIEYRYHDWWDGAGRDLMGDEYDFMKELAKNIFGLTHTQKWTQEW